MRRLGWVLATLVLIVVAVVSVAPAIAAEEEPHLVLFWAEGCPYCEAERRFLSEVTEDLPNLRIAEYEIRGSEANRALFAATMAERGLEAASVPTTIVGDRVWVGFDEARGEEIEAMLIALLSDTPEPEAPPSTIVEVPLLGAIDVGSHSLLVATIVIAFVDGFNPCSLWVLSMLLALALHSGSRRRILAVGAVFLTVTAAMYGLYIVGLFGALSYVAYTGWIRLAVAALALTIGLVNVKDYFALGRGPSMTIPEKRKPRLLGDMRRLARTDGPIAPMLGSTAALAVGVSLLETPCTAGFPILWTDLLSDHGVTLAAAAALFAVYMVVFLVDELAVFGGAVIAMRVSKVTEERGRSLKLIGGTVMVAMAGAMLLVPEAMESVAGVVAVFAAGAALAAGCAIGRRAWQAAHRGTSRPGRRRRRRAIGGGARG